MVLIDFKGNILTKNNLVVVDMSLQSNFDGISLFSKDFSLQIGESLFSSQSKYTDKLLDLGNLYKNNVLIETVNKVSDKNTKIHTVTFQFLNLRDIG